MRKSGRTYNIGVMKISVEERDADFQSIVDAAVAELEARLSKHSMELKVNLFAFTGPHLMPTEGTYAPLDFLQIGLTEKLERKFHFLLIVTEVDLSATIESYVLALPSQLTNIGLLSTKRLAPQFWGEAGGVDMTVGRLTAMMLHTLGHLLNLPHHPQPANVMYDFGSVRDLDQMEELTDDQLASMRRNLPREAREQVAHSRFRRAALTWIGANWATIRRAVRRANPIWLAFRLPTMVTAGFSLVSVLFFTAEIWDVTNALTPPALAVFSLLALISSTLAMNKNFALRAGSARDKTLAEAAVVTATATIVTLALTMLVLYVLFFGLGLAGAQMFFPSGLMQTWSTLDPAVDLVDHVKLSMFLGAMGVLAGALGGRAERAELIRYVLFMDEET